MSKHYTLDIPKQSLTFEGKTYTKHTLASFKDHWLQENDTSPILSDLYNFLVQWFDDSACIDVCTSGSTGTPKVLHVKKRNMMESAKNTCSFLALPKGSSVLLCMPLQFIGAKMIVVRALVAGLDLYAVTPSLNPLKDMSFSPNFVAMTPQQTAHCIQDAKTRVTLENVQHLLLGGMAVMPKLEKELRTFPNHVWLGYGMTETLSHIALRKVNTKDASPFFTPFTNIDLSLSEQECLIINAPKLCDEILITNDRAILKKDGSFQILGRIDNVVNSGGIKIQLEEVEEKLSQLFSIPLQLSAIAHEELGEQLVLLTENPCDNWKELCAGLSKYHRPKAHIIVPKLPLTASGKPNRHTSRKLAQEYFLG